MISSLGIRTQRGVLYQPTLFLIVLRPIVQIKKGLENDNNEPIWRKFSGVAAKFITHKRSGGSSPFAPTML